MRQLIINKNPDKNGLVIIEGKDYRYLRQVLRVKTGDMVNLRLPDGTLCGSTAAKIDEKSKKITLQLCASIAASSESSITRGVQASELEEQAAGGDGIEYTIFQFIPKPQKMEIIVRQATECGVKNIVPVISEYTEKGSVAAFEKNHGERFERIVREARQQSGSPVSTTIFEPVTVEEALKLWQELAAEGAGAAGFILSERNDGCKTVRQALETERSEQEGVCPSKIAIVCGNEGGISPEELELWVKKGLFYPVHFSVNILRCETAALYGIAAVQTGV